MTSTPAMTDPFPAALTVDAHHTDSAMARRRAGVASGRHGWPDQLRTQLLSASDEALLALRIEAGLLAQDLLDSGGCHEDGAEIQEPDGGALRDHPDAAGTPTRQSSAPPGVNAAPAPSEAELRQLVAEGHDAWQLFHASNVGLVLSVVRDVSHGIDDDLVQQGWLALGEAVRRYDMRLGYRFSTFAHHWIRNAVLTEYRRRASVVSASDGRLRNLALVSAVRAELAEQGHEADVSGVARRLGRPERWVEQHWTQPMRLGPDVAELEEPVLRGRLGQAQAADDEGNHVWWLDHLPEGERAVLVMRYGLDGRPPSSITQIARRWHCSAAEVRQLHRTALEHARRLVRLGEDAATRTQDARGANAGPEEGIGWLGLTG